MLDLLKAFENKRPELVFEWKDAETGAEGWVVINSLRGGAAGGGTRMRKGLDRREVESLAKTMEIKFSVSGPAIGIGRQAYADQAWTDGTRAAIAENQRAMDTVLTRHGLSIIGGTGLFRLIRHAPAAPLQVALATSGIWTRVFDERPDWMRLGVPGNADDLIRLDGGLGAALRLLDTG